MPYTTAQAVQDRISLPMLILLTDRGAEPTGQVGAAVLARAQADADAVIDGYLRAGGYEVPLAVASPIVTDIALALTVYKLHVTEPEAKVKADYQDAMKQLREIAARTLVLTDAAGAEPAATDGSGVQTADRDRPFTNENLRGFV
jgi:phage gp36-like protein